MTKKSLIITSAVSAITIAGVVIVIVRLQNRTEPKGGLTVVPPPITWNFGDRPLVSEVGWPSGDDGETYDIAGPAHVRIVLAGHSFSCMASHVYFDRQSGTKKDELKAMTVEVAGATLNGAVEDATRTMHEWNMSGGNIATWERTARSGDLSRYTASHLTKDASPNVSVSIVPNVADPARPWHLVFTVYWK